MLRCLRSDQPLLNLRLLRERRFSVGIITALGAVSSVVAALPLVA